MHDFEISSTKVYTMQVFLLEESDKAVRLRWFDDEFEADQTFWIPKSCLDPVLADREGSLHLLRTRGSAQPTCIDIQLWWLNQQNWFEEFLDLVEDEGE